VRRGIGSIAVAVALIASATLARAEAESKSKSKPVELRIATLAPEGSAWAKILAEAARDLESQTDGRVTTKLYTGASQGDERDVVRKMKLEQLDGGQLTAVGLSLIYPGIRVLELPFLFESVDEVDYVRDKMWPYFHEKFAGKGYVLAARGDVGWTYMYSNRAVKSRADVNKLKMWAWQDDPIVRALFRRIELNGVPLGVPEVLDALESGRIDACYGPPLAAVALQWYTKVTHATSLPVAYSMGAVVVRADAIAGLSKEDAAAFEKIGEAMGEKLVKRIRRDNKRALKAMVKSGITIDATPATLAAELESEAEGVRTDLVGKTYTQEELDAVIEYRDEYRAGRKKTRTK
jgi:TRAP-type C4-dicarboxylate transport system substrate-binding protein